MPAASQIDADGSAVAAGSGLDRAIGGTVDPLRWNWLFAVLLVVGWLGQASLRAWFSRAQAVPLDNPDETAYLIAARVLGGGPAADFSGNTLYRGGYPLLITPVYWFTSSPAAVYHAVLLINAAVSAAVMPLGYLACRRLGLGGPAAYGVAMVAALLPAGFFYSEYAIADAIFPVVTLAWLLATHSWLVATSPRARYAAAIGSAVLSGYAYAVHSRGLVLLAGFAAVGVFIAWRRPAARGSVAAAALTVVMTAAAGWTLDRYLASALYPGGTRSLSGQLVSTLGSVYGVIHVAEMAGGQLWRLVLDSWGIAGIGLVAAVAVIARPGVRTDLRVMASLSAGVTVLIACTVPAALPPHQSPTWASGRYLDGMTVIFFLVGAVVLLRAAARPILAFAACVAGPTMVAAVTVAVYAGTSLPTKRGKVFNFGEPAVLTQDWSQASVLVATAAALALLLVWVVLALLARRAQVLACILGAAVAVVSLVALAQTTAHCSRADNAWAQATGIREMAAVGGLKPGEQIAIATDLSGVLRLAQTFEVSSTQVQFFNPFRRPPPADVTVVDAVWPTGQPARASWPDAPDGWRVVAANRFGSWVVWRRLWVSGSADLCAERTPPVRVAGRRPSLVVVVESSRTTADLIVECLENEGVTHVFGLPGEENIRLVEALSRSSIRYVLTRHEQGASFMAEVYGRLTGRPGVCSATLGPGAINLLLGTADATTNSTPLIALSAQVGMNRSFKESHQGVDLVPMFAPVTKWSALVATPGAVPEMIRKAFKLAQTERPGAVYLAIPEDVEQAPAPGREKPLTVNVPRPDEPSPGQVERAAALLCAAHAPIVLAGHGAARGAAGPALRRFAETLGIPVATTFHGKGVFPDDHPLALGAVGFMRHDYVNFGFDRADLIIAVGYELQEFDPIRVNPQGDTKIIHLHRFPAEVDAHYDVAVGLHSDIGRSLDALADAVGPRSEVTAGGNRIRSLLVGELARGQCDDRFPLAPARIVADTRAALRREDIVLVDTGALKMWMARLYPTYEPNTCLISNGLSTMAWTVPGAIGAKIARPDCRVLVATGDGAFLMNSQEIETAMRLGLAVVILIWVDDAYGLISWKMDLEIGRNVDTTFGNPDFVAYAQAFGATGYRIRSAGELLPTLRTALAADTVSVIACPVDYSANLELIESLGDLDDSLA